MNIMMNEAKRDFDGVAATWDSHPVRVRLAGDVFRAMALETNLNDSMDVLDFGCGTGLLTMRLQLFVRSVKGVDSSRGMLEVLNEKIAEGNIANVKTSFLDTENGGILKGSYHLITSSMTFHHIRNIGPVLDQFYKVLLPGGKICIADLDSEDGRFHESNEGVFHFGFEREDLIRIISDAGFKDVKSVTASVITKPVQRRQNKKFSVFLITGSK